MSGGPRGSPADGHRGRRESGGGGAGRAEAAGPVGGVETVEAFAVHSHSSRPCHASAAQSRTTLSGGRAVGAADRRVARVPPAGEAPAGAPAAPHESTRGARSDGMSADIWTDRQKACTHTWSAGSSLSSRGAAARSRSSRGSELMCCTQPKMESHSQKYRPPGAGRPAAAAPGETAVPPPPPP
eukprot:scaffold10071_cov90-Isochrysis_galbana.AAC.4